MDTKKSKNTKEEKINEAENEYKNKYLRALADYQNLDRRIQQEKIQIAKDAQVRTIVRLLPFLDNLEKAEVFVQDQGLKMIKNQFIQALHELGLQEVELLHTQFNPEFAEAIETVKGEKDNEVVEVVEKAYAVNGKIVRIGRVKVAKKK